MQKNFLSLREIQLAELDILLKAAKFFDDNGINYMLCSGTLLGAARHKGFIPWDDDIDLYMPRDDFENLRALVKNEKKSINGIDFHFPGDDGYIYPYIKATNPKIFVDYGKPGKNNLWIDIFPLDHFPDNKIIHKIYVKYMLMLQAALSMSTYTKEYMKEHGYYDSMKSRIKLLIAKCIYKIFGGHKKMSVRMDRIARDLDRKYKNSAHVGDGSWPNGTNDYFSVSWIFPVTKIEFEGHFFNAAKDYHKALAQFFGEDYMTPPPEGKRHIHYMTAWRV